MVIKANKYRAKRTVVDGISFQSKLEADRWCVLRTLERSGEITHLERQPAFLVSIKGVPCFTYVADFRYFSRPTNAQRGEYITEDVKGFRTAIYKLKKKCVEAAFPGLKIVEVTNPRADVLGWKLRKKAA